MKRTSNKQGSGVVGAAVHNGWAVLVTVAVDRRTPVVVDRRRVELCDSELPSQPYHHEAAELDLAAAEALVQEVKESVVQHAGAALSQLLNDVSAGCKLVALAVREPRELPGSLAEILNSRPATYIADSEMYLAALSSAAAELGLSVSRYPRSGEFEFAANELGTGPDLVADFISGLRETLGSPWQKDHKAAAAAAFGVLAGLERVVLPKP